MDGIDRDRGCRMKFHPSGYRVATYVDAPGEYINELGRPVSEKVAREAGFDVDREVKEKAKQAKMKEYRDRVESEFASVEEQVERELSEVTESRTVRHVGSGKYAVYEDGARLTTKPLTREEAEAMLEASPEFTVPGE